jgi:hypothetical protein
MVLVPRDNRVRAVLLRVEGEVVYLGAGAVDMLATRSISSRSLRLRESAVAHASHWNCLHHAAACPGGK